MTDRELMQQALEALESLKTYAETTEPGLNVGVPAITALRERLAQPERHELQAKGEHPAPCARHCEANAFQIVIKNLKAQLAKPEQEPVAWVKQSGELVVRADYGGRLYYSEQSVYTTPLQLDLTDAQIDAACEAGNLYRIDFIRAYRAAHGIKGEA